MERLEHKHKQEEIFFVLLLHFPGLLKGSLNEQSFSWLEEKQLMIFNFQGTLGGAECGL